MVSKLPSPRKGFTRFHPDLQHQPELTSCTQFVEGWKGGSKQRLSSIVSNDKNFKPTIKPPRSEQRRSIDYANTSEVEGQAAIAAIVHERHPIARK
jgi:hypothetical protein